MCDRNSVISYTPFNARTTCFIAEPLRHVHMCCVFARRAGFGSAGTSVKKRVSSSTVTCAFLISFNRCAIYTERLHYRTLVQFDAFVLQSVSHCKRKPRSQTAGRIADIHTFTRSLHACHVLLMGPKFQFLGEAKLPTCTNPMLECSLDVTKAVRPPELPVLW